MAQRGRPRKIPLTTEQIAERAVAAANAPVPLKRKINPELLKKYEGYSEERDEHMDMDIRGEKSQKIAEWATVVKHYSVNSPTKCVAIPAADFTRMMGGVKQGVSYVRSLMVHRFGIPHIRILVGSDKIKMWSRTAVK